MALYCTYDICFLLFVFYYYYFFFRGGGKKQALALHVLFNTLLKLEILLPNKTRRHKNRTKATSHKTSRFHNKSKENKTLTEFSAALTG